LHARRDPLGGLRQRGALPLRLDDRVLAELLRNQPSSAVVETIATAKNTAGTAYGDRSAPPRMAIMGPSEYPSPVLRRSSLCTDCVRLRQLWPFFDGLEACFVVVDHDLQVGVAFADDSHSGFDPFDHDVEVAAGRLALFANPGLEMHLELPHLPPNLAELGIDTSEALVHAVESLVHAVESLVHGVEALAHAVEPRVHGVEALVYPVESLVDARKSFVDSNESVVDAVGSLVVRRKAFVHAFETVDDGSMQILNRHSAAILPSSATDAWRADFHHADSLGKAWLRS
jgi:hypothetical protein